MKKNSVTELKQEVRSPAAAPASRLPQKWSIARIDETKEGCLSRLDDKSISAEQREEIDANGNTLLMVAAIIGRLDIVQDLQANGADIFREKQFGYTAFDLAVMKNQEEMARYLLTQGFKDRIDRLTRDGLNPLARAIKHGYPNMVVLLLNEKADYNQKLKIGDGVRIGDYAVTQWEEAVNELDRLVAQEQNPRIHDLQNCVVRITTQRSIVKVLQDSASREPLKISNKARKKIDLLQNKHIEILSRISREKISTREHFMRLLSYSGMNHLLTLPEIDRALVNAPHPQTGYTLLMYIAMEKSNPIRFLRWLLDNGAEVNQKNKQGQTALMLAARTDNHEIALYLLEHGAFLLIEDDTGCTALNWAKSESMYQLLKVWDPEEKTNVEVKQIKLDILRPQYETAGLTKEGKLCFPPLGTSGFVHVTSCVVNPLNYVTTAVVPSPIGVQIPTVQKLMVEKSDDTAFSTSKRENELLERLSILTAQRDNFHRRMGKGHSNSPLEKQLEQLDREIIQIRIELEGIKSKQVDSKEQKSQKRSAFGDDKRIDPKSPRFQPPSLEVLDVITEEVLEQSGNQEPKSDQPLEAPADDVKLGPEVTHQQPKPWPASSESKQLLIQNGAQADGIGPQPKDELTDLLEQLRKFVPVLDWMQEESTISAELEFINGEKFLKEFHCELRQVLNQKYLAACVISSGHISHNGGNISVVAEVVDGVSSGIPVIGSFVSLTAKGAKCASQYYGQVQMSKLVSYFTSSEVAAKIFSAASRQITVAYQDVILGKRELEAVGFAGNIQAFHREVKQHLTIAKQAVVHHQVLTRPQAMAKRIASTIVDGLQDGQFGLKEFKEHGQIDGSDAAQNRQMVSLLLKVAMTSDILMDINLLLK